MQRSYEPEDGALRGERLRGRAAATGKGFDTSVVVNEETNRQHSPTVRFFVVYGSPYATELRTAGSVLSEGQRLVQLSAMD